MTARPTLYPDVHIIVASFFCKKKISKGGHKRRGVGKVFKGSTLALHINNFWKKVLISKSLDPLSILQIGKTTNSNDPTSSSTIQWLRSPRSFWTWALLFNTNSAATRWFSPKLWWQETFGLALIVITSTRGGAICSTTSRRNICLKASQAMDACVVSRYEISWAK